MHSKLYVGQVRHKRFTPHEHAFNYTMFMMYLDLDEIPHLFDRFWLWSARRFNLAQFDRKCHLGNPEQPLKQAVKDLVHIKTGIILNGPVRILTHLRYFGYGFNPVSFYYCFDKEDKHLQVIVAEVNNTPWGEQHCYVLPVNPDQAQARHHQYQLQKEFHVSPFNPMDQDYDWRFSTPENHLAVHMENWREGDKIFAATLSLDAEAISSTSMAKALLQFPLMTLKVTAAIYYQAFKLLLKRTPLFTHPDKLIPQVSKHKRG